VRILQRTLREEPHEATDATAGRWVPYVQVDDLDSAVDNAISNGGTMVHPASEGPAGTSVTIADPGGALLALFKQFSQER
jgi:predicted enzyme related to lactoylglutathione lyase